MRLLLIICIGFTGTIWAQEDWSPTYPTLSRYRATWQSNPFVRASEATGEDFAANLKLSGLSRIGDSWTVLLVDRQSNRFESLSTGGTSTKGLRIIKVLPHEDRLQAKVIISNGEQEATLRFDREEDSQKPAPTTSEDTAIKLPLQLDSSGEAEE